MMSKLTTELDVTVLELTRFKAVLNDVPADQQESGLTIFEQYIEMARFNSGQIDDVQQTCS